MHHHCCLFVAKPKSPEDVSIKNVTANSCTAEWTPPKSDGGVPITGTLSNQAAVNFYFQFQITAFFLHTTGYNVEVCDESTGIWSPVPGLVRGTSVDIPGLTEGKRYKVRVSAVNQLGASEPMETLVSFVAKNPFGKSLYLNTLNDENYCSYQTVKLQFKS